MLDAIGRNRDLLIANHFILDIYGPNRQDYDMIQKLIEEMNLKDIVALKGEIIGNEKKKALLESDIFFLTSRFEGHPMGLIEALSYGLPCFITPGANMAKEIAEYECGWVADFSVDSISANLLKMIEQRANFAKLGQNSKELSRIYAWDKLATTFHIKVESLLSLKKQIDVEQ